MVDEIRVYIEGGGDEKETKTALMTHPDAFNALLVDSEGLVDADPRQYLQRRDGWDLQCNNDHCHLMVQTMEAWLIADLDALSKFYGQGFIANALPRNPNVEQIDKEQLAPALKAATEQTSKGKYHKTRHAPKILEQLDSAKVRRAARHCERLFQTLSMKMGDRQL